jgi:aminopeptidase-like protein
MSKNINKYYKLAKNILFPICRSITGKGIRKTLSIIKQQFPELKIRSISSGTRVFDWTIPNEWNVSDAYVMDSKNKKIIDFKKNNLHLVGYSIPINKLINKSELFKHLHTLKDNSFAIPYITSYYKKYWGFCINLKDYNYIKKNYTKDERFKVVIKSELKESGFLRYGELVIKGKSSQEILISTYLCHPSMANNELSGPIVSMCLIDYFSTVKKLKKTLRFIFIPETIGSIAYLSKNLLKLKKNIIGGYNLTCLGDEGAHSCMFSKYKNSKSDQSLIEAYKKLNLKYKIYSFLERGSDERQYNSVGIELPIASIFRSKYGTYPKYHTSLDDFNFVTKKGIAESTKVARKAIEILSDKIIPKNKILCEPFMTKRNLYPTLSMRNNRTKDLKNIMNFLQYADGKNDLCDISALIDVNKKKTIKIFNKLKKRNLISS